MSDQATGQSYSGAMASDEVEGWASGERAQWSPNRPDPRLVASWDGSPSTAERFTTFGFVEYRPRE